MLFPLPNLLYSIISNLDSRHVDKGEAWAHSKFMEIGIWTSSGIECLLSFTMTSFSIAKLYHKAESSCSNGERWGYPSLTSGDANPVVVAKIVLCFQNFRDLPPFLFVCLFLFNSQCSFMIEIEEIIRAL